jgi:hypothetical protein
VDTRIFCHQINPYGQIFPQAAHRILGPKIFGINQPESNGKKPDAEPKKKKVVRKT